MVKESVPALWVYIAKGKADDEEGIYSSAKKIPGVRHNGPYLHRSEKLSSVVSMPPFWWFFFSCYKCHIQAGQHSLDLTNHGRCYNDVTAG